MLASWGCYYYPLMVCGLLMFLYSMSIGVIYLFFSDKYIFPAWGDNISVDYVCDKNRRLVSQKYCSSIT